ncbi:MAG: hypothetical protein CMJ46_16195 [Planctomyces sp.]|nr:hypothetical protein [Planctomyces sp.]
MRLISITPNFEESMQIDEETIEWEECFNITAEPEGDETLTYFDVLTWVPTWRPGSPHPRFITARVSGVEVDRVDDADLWEAVVRYRIGGSVEEDDPTLEPAEIEWTTNEIMMPILRDQEGRPLLNTAGDILEYYEPVSYWVLSVKKKVAAVPRWVRDYDNAINDGAITIDGQRFGKHELQLKKLKIGGYQESSTGVLYREMSFELHQNPNTWITQIWNRGLFELVRTRVPATSVGLENPVPDAPVPTVEVIKRVRIVDDEGNPITTPTFLDRNGQRPRIYEERDGQQIEVGVKTELDPTDFVSLEFETKKVRPFNRLPLT